MLLIPLYRPLFLTWQDIQIIRLLMADAPANKEAAYELGLTEGSIKRYLSCMFKTLRSAGYPLVKNRISLVAWGMQHLEAV